MLEYDPVRQEVGNAMIVSRGATAIYLALRKLGYAGFEALVPANLCYAGVYPVIYAGMIPRFCDVDRESGNVSLTTVTDAWNERIRVMIIPHMYGNPVRDLAKIASFCQEKGIKMIEDCASAMGAEADGYELGKAGDYCVYSTGYSKTIDLGYGGVLVCREHKLETEEELEKELPEETEDGRKNAELFSAIYRTLRNHEKDSSLKSGIYELFPQICRNTFLCKIGDQQKKNVLEAVKLLPEVVQRRRRAWENYQIRLAGILNASLYSFSEGAVPWRANLLISDPLLRRRIIRECLECHLPVSDWYPRVTCMFGQHGEYPGARWHEEHILNFPLDVSKETMDAICSLLKRILEE